MEITPSSTTRVKPSSPLTPRFCASELVLAFRHLLISFNELGEQVDELAIGMELAQVPYPELRALRHQCKDLTAVGEMIEHYRNLSSSLLHQSGGRLNKTLRDIETRMPADLSSIQHVLQELQDGIDELKPIELDLAETDAPPRQTIALHHFIFGMQRQLHQLQKLGYGMEDRLQAYQAATKPVAMRR